MRVYLFIAAVAGAATYLLTPLVRHLAIDVGAVGEIRARDVHKVPTPRMGGLAMLLGFAVSLCFAQGLPWIGPLMHSTNQAWIILLGAALICLLGICDDIWDLDWMLKMSGQILISVLVSWQGVQIVSLPWGRGLITASPSLSMAVTAFLIVASINAVNFVDGLDGLASGIVAIGGIAFATYAYVLARDQPSFASMAIVIDVALVGVCVGFLMHNWHPAKLFMGDSGSMLLGYLLTCASIVITGHLDPSTMDTFTYLPIFMPLLLPILVLFLPVLDMVLAIIRRLAHGESPMHPDRMHLHHRMIRIGHTIRSAVLILWAWAAVIAFGSVTFLFVPWWQVLIGACIVIPVLTLLTALPYLLRRIPQIRAEHVERRIRRGEVVQPHGIHSSRRAGQHVREA